MDSDRFETIDVGRIRVAGMKVISKRQFDLFCGANIRAFVEGRADVMVIELEAYVLGMPKERIAVHERYPLDWWQAFRERWFPKWWLRRWPVAYKTIDIDQQLYGPLCPHIAVEGLGPHALFLRDGVMCVSDE
jgi:hypothetical protein